ncbi:alpha/beta hydrolase [Paenibacillus silvisoli]|uniref:alpha/beta hydrolase n=1 Tax=Paenibacillus silvisoli TaxID=3110539 RepID=UPI00280573F0|nr:alpha/beta hydrolase [Paenibacillus silvisoli]
MLEQREGKFRGTDERELFYRVQLPAGRPPKAVVIAVHGHGDHSGGLLNLLDRLAERGYAVYAYDQRGYGQSEGIRGYIKQWSEYTNDLHTFRTMVQDEQPRLPVFLVGHSLGGLVCIDYVMSHGKGLSGLVAIAPAISARLSLADKLLTNLLGWIKPDLTVQKSGDYASLTSDPDMLARLEADELRHSTVTPGLGRGLTQAVPRVMKQAKALKLPFLLQLSAEDRVTPPDGQRLFYEALGSPDKQKLEYANAGHRPFDDRDRERFLADLGGWLDHHCDK